MNMHFGLRSFVVFVLLLSATAKAATPLAAEIRWTRHGVPHIKARDYESLGFGYGYAVAPDRLCLLADRILTLRGERSRWFGSDAPVVAGFVPTTSLNSDLFHRIQLAPEVVAAASKALSTDARAISRGYAAGYTKFVEELSEQERAIKCKGAPIPVMDESDVIRAMLSIGVLWKSFQILPFAAASVWGVEPAPPSKQPTALVTGPPASFGSNAWAYGGDATRTDSAIVMGNPHTFWRDNWLSMHQLHLTIPGQIDVAGADFAGLPLPVTGFNNDVAWSIEAPATVTYYVLQKMQVEAGDQPTYAVDGQRRRLRIVPLVLEIKQADGSLAKREFPIAWSELGALYQLPAFPGRPQGWYAVTDAAEANALGLDQLLAIARSKSVVEFRDGVVRYRGLGSHLIAGDRHGAALYVEAGTLLDIDATTLDRCRVQGARFNVFDGTRTECWVRDNSGVPRLAATDKQPALLTRGIVHNSNNSYHRSVLGEPVQGYSPLLGEADQHDLRLPMSERRMREIMQDGRVTAVEALAVVFDNRNYAAESWLTDILGACKQERVQNRVVRACAVLAAWDRRNDVGSRGALFFETLWPRLEKVPGLFATEQAESASTARAIKINPETKAQIIAAVDATGAELAALKLMGDEPWGNILTARAGTSRVALHGGSGDAGVLNALGGAGLSEGGYAEIVSGSAYVQLVRWESGRVISEVVLAHGQSADPNSPHCCDQLTLFANKQLVRLPFLEEEIRADAEYKVQQLRQAP